MLKASSVRMPVRAGSGGLRAGLTSGVVAEETKFLFVPVLLERASTAFDADNRGAQHLVQAVTSEPIFSPAATRTMFPCSRMLKTIMGILLSRQSETAVVSITPRLRRRMSLYVICSKRSALGTFLGSAE